MLLVMPVRLRRVHLLGSEQWHRSGYHRGASGRTVRPVGAVSVEPDVCRTSQRSKRGMPHWAACKRGGTAGRGRMVGCSSLHR